MIQGSAVAIVPRGSLTPKRQVAERHETHIFFVRGLIIKPLWGAFDIIVFKVSWGYMRVHVVWCTGCKNGLLLDNGCYLKPILTIWDPEGICRHICSVQSHFWSHLMHLFKKIGSEQLSNVSISIFSIAVKQIVKVQLKDLLLTFTCRVVAMGPSVCITSAKRCNR